MADWTCHMCHVVQTDSEEGSHYSRDPLRHEVYYQFFRYVVTWKMAGPGVGPSPAAAIHTLFTVEPKLLEENPEVVLCCIDTEGFQIRFSGVTCLEIVARRCHIAVPGDPPGVRRLCLLPDRDVDSTFVGVPSPVKIRIKSSSTIKFNCTLDVSKMEAWGTLLWEMEMLPTDRTALNLQPVTRDIPDLPHEMHLQPVDLNLRYPDQCNCLKSMQSPPIIVDMTPDVPPDPLASTLQDLNLSEEESDDSDHNTDTEEQDGNTDSEEQDDTIDIPLCGLIFTVAGSPWQTNYQDALDICALDIWAGNAVEIRAAFEPDNLKDKNAIKIEVFVESSWQIVGYCPGCKVPKLTRAMKKGIVTEIALDKIKRYYCPPANKFMFRASVKVVKKGSWEKDCLSYKYNSVIVI